MTQISTGSVHIHPDQLTIGLYVRLELDWLQHPFTFNQFKITSQDQINTLRALKLDQIRVDLKRSDCPPLAIGKSPPPAQELSEAQQAAIAAKQKRVEQLAQYRNALNACERRFCTTAKAVQEFSRDLSSQPEQVVTQSRALIEGLISSLLTEQDIAIHLMTDKVGGEELYIHQLNVAVLALMLGRRLGLDHDQLSELGMGALFHDAAATSCKEDLQFKSEPLSGLEKSELSQHISAGITQAQRLQLGMDATAIIMQHHEHVDGSGVPNGLKGDAISLLAKIVKVVDDYDCLSNRLNAKDVLTPFEALAMMFAQSRKRYDPQVLGVFIQCMGVYPPGTLVELSNHALGLVVAVNASKPLKPTVLINDPSVPRHEAVVLDLEQEADLSIIRSVRPAQLSKQAFAYLSPQKRMNYFCDVATPDGA